MSVHAYRITMAIDIAYVAYFFITITAIHIQVDIPSPKVKTTYFPFSCV